MANWINHDEDLKKHEKRGKSNFRTQSLFGIIKDIYHRMNRSEPAIVFATRETIEALKAYQIEFEQRKSEALLHLFDRARAY